MSAKTKRRPRARAAPQLSKSRRPLPVGNCVVRVTVKTRRRLDELKRDDETITEVIEQAVEREFRQRRLESVNAAYEKLTPDQRAAGQAERDLWDATLGDGLDDASK